MTDRYVGLLVVLDQDMREDDAESLINAILHLRHVIEVKPVETDWSAEHAHRIRVRMEIAERLTDMAREMLRSE